MSMTSEYNLPDSDGSTNLDHIHERCEQITRYVTPLSIHLPYRKRQSFSFKVANRFAAYGFAIFVSFGLMFVILMTTGISASDPKIAWSGTTITLALLIYSELLRSQAFDTPNMSALRPRLEFVLGIFPKIVMRAPNHVHVIRKVGGYPAKRAFDIIVAGFAIVFFSPLLFIVATLVNLQDGGPAFYLHTKRGYAGKPFICLKIRTMVVDSDWQLRKLLEKDREAAAEWNSTRKLRNDPRITKIGRFLRKTSIDEIPQLFNVLKGDMSIVGPRPITPKTANLYGERIGYYDSMRPGITGLWQVSGRNDTTFEERVEIDVQYVRGYSLYRDFIILLKTIPVLLTSKGAY